VRGIGIRRNDPARIPEFLELDINHYEGDSGGPVFTRQGRLLGIMSARQNGANRASFAIPSNKVRAAYLSQVKLAAPP
jgi:S1-C subfamily serine protease